jgi:FKBP-type peptidyl-prolyl cis-trans isomerase
MRKSPLIVAAAVAVTSSFALIAVAQNPTAANPATAPAGVAAAEANAATTAPTTQETLQKVSYGMGFQLGRNMKEVDVQLDVATLTKGIEDAMAGKESQFKEADIKDAFAQLQQTVAEKEQSKLAAAASKAEGEGKAFLEANKAKAGVKTTASGLQYEITTEGIQLLKVGSKARLYIPSNLAYGPQGRPPQIAPNSTLIFDVELLDIVPPATQPAFPGLPGGATPPPQMPQ